MEISSAGAAGVNAMNMGLGGKVEKKDDKKESPES